VPQTWVVLGPRKSSPLPAERGAGERNQQEAAEKEDGKVGLTWRDKCVIDPASIVELNIGC